MRIQTLKERTLDRTGGKAQLQLRNGSFFVRAINPITGYETSQKLERATTTKEALRQFKHFVRAGSR